ncbi:MAG: hypothetical protein PHV03_10795 [Desulfitobacteriaceae bacterium]|nr:hypothetical protein [Desulfitobacteriaceae bacterium]
MLLFNLGLGPFGTEEAEMNIEMETPEVISDFWQTKQTNQRSDY